MMLAYFRKSSARNAHAADFAKPLLNVAHEKIGLSCPAATILRTLNTNVFTDGTLTDSTMYVEDTNQFV